LEFGIGVRGPECFYDGAIRWSKKFSDTFSRFDTIPAVTDSHPASHPASHVAVAITLNAKASSLKIDLLSSSVKCIGTSHDYKHWAKRTKPSDSTVTSNSLSANSPACPRNVSPRIVQRSADVQVAKRLRISKCAKSSVTFESTLLEKHITIRDDRTVTVNSSQ